MKSIKNQIVIDLIMEMNENKKDEEIGKASEQRKERRKEEMASRLLTPGLDNTRLFMRLTAGAGT